MAVKGAVPWNKGKKGTQPANKTSFQKGNVPWNKGLKGIHLSPNSEFKKGQVYNKNIRPFIDKQCAHCSKAFRVKSYLKRVRHCSQSCAAKNRNMGGANHWNWKGGISSHDRLERVRFQKEMQKQIFERDGYRCVLCKQTNKPLQVDHIQPWAEYVKLRFSADNCRTLCMDCHYKITFQHDKPKHIKAWGHNLRRI